MEHPGGLAPAASRNCPVSAHGHVLQVPNSRTSCLRNLHWPCDASHCPRRIWAASKWTACWPCLQATAWQAPVLTCLAQCDCSRPTVSQPPAATSCRAWVPRWWTWTLQLALLTSLLRLCSRRMQHGTVSQACAQLQQPPHARNVAGPRSHHSPGCPRTSRVDKRGLHTPVSSHCGSWRRGFWTGHCTSAVHCQHAGASGTSAHLVRMCRPASLPQVIPCLPAFTGCAPH